MSERTQIDIRQGNTNRSSQEKQMKKKVKVLVSTKQTQGQRKNDFNFVPEDELVAPSVIGSCGDAKADDSCGCARSLIGIDSFKATTTAEVVERELNQTQLAKLV